MFPAGPSAFVARVVFSDLVASTKLMALIRFAAAVEQCHGRYFLLTGNFERRNSGQ